MVCPYTLKDAASFLYKNSPGMNLNSSQTLIVKILEFSACNSTSALFSTFLQLFSHTMGIRIPGITNVKDILRRSSSLTKFGVSEIPHVPKGCFAVYVGAYCQRRYVVPVWYLHEPIFQDLLRKAEEEFGFDHLKGGLTIPCREDIFTNLISTLNR